MSVLFIEKEDLSVLFSTIYVFPGIEFVHYDIGMMAGTSRKIGNRQPENLFLTTDCVYLPFDAIHYL